MGFSWAPRIAQAVSSFLVTFHWEFDAWDGDLHPFLIAQQHGVTRGVVIILYDNFLFIADSRATRDTLVTQFLKNCRVFGAVIKTAELSEGHVSFGGGLFAVNDGSLNWSHEAANISGWREKGPPRPNMTCREWSEYLII